MNTAAELLDDPRDRFEQAVELAIGTGRVSRAILQRNFRIAQGAAIALLHLLYAEGVISQPDPDTGACRVLVRWMPVDWDSCPDCGAAAEILTSSRQAGYAYDGDLVRCEDRCGAIGGVSIEDADSAWVNWVFEEEESAA